jgi:hypothetical protein
MSEHANQTEVRLRFSRMRKGILLRYQVGTFIPLNSPHPVKIGEVGVSDLIGVTEYVIRPEDVGRKVGVFTALEMKATKGGRVSNEQKNFGSRVLAHGGIFGVVRSGDEMEKVIEGYRPAVTGNS